MTILTQEQYNLLNEQRDAFEELQKTQSTGRLSRRWLVAMEQVHFDLFRRNVCLTCPVPIAAAMTRLFTKMKEYESQANSGKSGKKDRGGKSNGDGSGGGAGSEE